MSRILTQRFWRTFVIRCWIFTHNLPQRQSLHLHLLLLLQVLDPLNHPLHLPHHPLQLNQHLHPLILQHLQVNLLFLLVNQHLLQPSLLVLDFQSRSQELCTRQVIPPMLSQLMVQPQQCQQDTNTRCKPKLQHPHMQVLPLSLPPHNLRHSHLPLLNFHQVILHLYTTNLQGVILLIQITEVAAIHPTIVGVHLLTIVVGLLLTIVGDLLLTIAGVLQITEDLHLQIIIDLIRHPLIIEVIMDLGDLQMTDIEAEVIMGLHLIMVIVDHLQGVLHPMMVTEDHLLTGIHHIIDLQDQGEATMVADIN